MKQTCNSSAEPQVREIVHCEQMVSENTILGKSLERAAMSWGIKAEKSLPAT